MQMKVYRTDVFAFIKKCTLKYDIIFADPPFVLPGIMNLPGMIFEKQILNPGGWFVLEHSGDFNFSKTPYFLNLRKYGSVHFSIFEMNG